MMASKKTCTAKKTSTRSRRPGGGRKPSNVAQARAELATSVEDTLTYMVPGCIANLKRLADGGYERVTQTFELAATITREDVVRDKDGNPTFDSRGNVVIGKQPAFPDAQPGELVLTRRVVEVADADRAANEYLINRRLGRPKQAVELSGPDGAPIPVSIEAAIDLIYGETEPDMSALAAAGFSGDV